MIKEVTYERLYNLGNYENEKLGVTVSVQDDDIETAFDRARSAVEAEHDHLVRLRNAQSAQRPTGLPATPKQRNYIATLQDQLAWTSEQLVAYANEQGVNLAVMDMRQASAFIDGLKRLTEERGATDRPPPLAD